MARAKTPRVRTTREAAAIVERALEVLGDEVERIHQRRGNATDEDLQRLQVCTRAALAVMKERREQAGAKELPKVPDAQLVEAMAQALAADFGVAPGALMGWLREQQRRAAS